MKDWPIHKLVYAPECCIFHYFKWVYYVHTSLSILGCHFVNKKRLKSCEVPGARCREISLIPAFGMQNNWEMPRSLYNPGRANNCFNGGMFINLRGTDKCRSRRGGQECCIIRVGCFLWNHSTMRILLSWRASDTVITVLLLLMCHYCFY